MTTVEQNIFKTRIVGHNKCADVTSELIEATGFKSGYKVDNSKWTYIVGKGFDEDEPIINSRLFKEMVEALEVPIVRRVCPTCSSSHKDIFYRRLTKMPETFDLLDTLMNNWYDVHNKLNEDFALYSSYSDALYDKGRWSFCNYNHFGVGFPRDCGPSGFVGSNWH